LNAYDLMSPQVVVAKENTNAEQICSRLLAGEFNGVPVVDDNGAVVVYFRSIPVVFLKSLAGLVVGIMRRSLRLFVLDVKTIGQKESAL
jgi:CBS domain-containing protein